MGRMLEASLANMKFRINTVLPKKLCYKTNYRMPKARLSKCQQTIRSNPKPIFLATLSVQWPTDRQTELFIYVSLPSHIQLYNITNNKKGTSHLDVRETRTWLIIWNYTLWGIPLAAISRDQVHTVRWPSDDTPE